MIEWHVAPQGQKSGTGFTVAEDLALGAAWRGDDSIINSIIVCKWRNADERPLAHAVAGQNIHEHHVVIDRERGNRGTVIPHEIVLAPSLTITLECEIRVVRDDVSVYVLHALLHQLIGELFEHLYGLLVAGSVQRVGQFASREGGVASPHEHQSPRRYHALGRTTAALHPGTSTVRGT